jgi:Trypsin-like peptidase domain
MDKCSLDRLPPLSGTASDETWRITTSDRSDANGQLAICAIVRRPPTATPSLKGTDGSELIGTGFYLVPNGGFATARHVALEALDAMSQGEHSVGLVYSLSSGLLAFRSVWRFFLHPTADLAFGIPHEIYDNKTEKPFNAPPIGSRISTWAYPLHRRTQNSEGRDELQLQPAFYDGILEQIYTGRGPAVKIQPPYYQTNIHLHGGASGGPVFNERGRVFGVASCSYDGAIDFAFVTPIGGILDIELDDTNLSDGRGSRTVTVSELANLGLISIGERGLTLD